ncbi:uncharacterized protein LOC144504095 [Mustelus asterias]
MRRRRQQQQDGGAQQRAGTSGQSGGVDQAEVETAFQQLYNSLLGNKEKVETSAPKNSHSAHTAPQKDLYNLLALGDVPQNKLKSVPHTLKSGCSILSEHVWLRTIDSGTAISSICSTEAETARLPAKIPDLKCNASPGKEEGNLKSNAEPLSSAVEQPILKVVGSSGTNSNGNGEDLFELSSDDAISINSGEGYREMVTCEVCSEMFWKVVNKKETKKRERSSGKKKPYDPTSLSCDQWVLKKPLLRSHQQKLGREIYYLKKSIGTPVLREATRKWIPRCSRPHVFLQRNLRSGRRKVDEFLAKRRKKQPKRMKKRSRKKELFVFQLPESPASSTVISDTEDSEMKMSTVKRKLTSAVLSRRDRTKRSSCDFSEDDSNTCESGFYSNDSKSMQCESSTCTNPVLDSRLSNFNPGETASAFSTLAFRCPENQLHSPNEKAKTWEAIQSKINSRITPPSSFDWLKPGGFMSLIARLKARPLNSSGSVVKET